MNKSQITMLSIFGLVIALMGSSIKNTYQVFINTMSNDFSLSRGDFLISGAIFMLGVGIASPVVGLISDKYGVKSTIYLGLVLSGITFLSLGLSSNFIVFSLVYGLLASFAYSAISYIPLGIIIYKNIPSGAKNIVYALVTNGTALGFILFSPLWILLEGYFSWREIYFLLAVIFLFPLIIYSKYIFSYISVDQSSDTSSSCERSDVNTVFHKHLGFYLLMFGFFGCGFTMAYIDVHWVSQLKDANLESKIIAAVLAIFGIFEFAGAILFGKLLDKYNNVLILSICYFIRGVSLLILFLSQSNIALIAFAILFGISFMGTVISTTAMIIRFFPHNKGLVLGFIWLSHQVGAFLSVRYGGVLYDNASNYDQVLFITACVALISSIISIPLFRFSQAMPNRADSRLPKLPRKNN